MAKPARRYVGKEHALLLYIIANDCRIGEHGVVKGRMLHTTINVRKIYEPEVVKITHGQFYCKAKLLTVTLYEWMYLHVLFG